MTTQFRMTPSMTRGAEIVEVWVDGMFVASIYPTDSGVRLISKHKTVCELGAPGTPEGTSVIEVTIMPKG